MISKHNFSPELQQLYNHINELVRISESDFNEISSNFELKIVKKKQVILEPDQVSKHMRFIVSGCVRVYFLDDDATEKTLQIGIDNWWINDLYSYITQSPSKMYIQTLEETKILQISKSNLEELFLHSNAITNFFRIKIQNAYVSLQERTKENMINDAYARYQKFRTEYRNIEQRVPQYIIASYLDITPEFLSFLRKKHKS